MRWNKTPTAEQNIVAQIAALGDPENPRIPNRQPNLYIQSLSRLKPPADGKYNLKPDPHEKPDRDRLFLILFGRLGISVMDPEFIAYLEKLEPDFHEATVGKPYAKLRHEIGSTIPPQAPVNKALNHLDDEIAEFFGNFHDDVLHTTSLFARFVVARAMESLPQDLPDTG